MKLKMYFSPLMPKGQPRPSFQISIFVRGHSVITFSQNEQNLDPLRPCSHLFDFGNISSCEPSKRLHQPPTTTTTTHSLPKQ